MTLIEWVLMLMLMSLVWTRLNSPLFMLLVTYNNSYFSATRVAVKIILVIDAFESTLVKQFIHFFLYFPRLIILNFVLGRGAVKVAVLDHIKARFPDLPLLSRNLRSVGCIWLRTSTVVSQKHLTGFQSIQLISHLANLTASFQNKRSRLWLVEFNRSLSIQVHLGNVRACHWQFFH